MTDVLVSALTVFFCLAVAGLVCYAVLAEVFERRLGVSSMPMAPRVRREMLAQLSPQVAGDIVELGSGWGGLAMAAARAFPDRRVVAVEYSPLPFVISWLRQKLFCRAANLVILRRDFRDMDLSSAAACLCYLSNPIMAALQKKFLTELPAGAQIVSSTFHMPDWQPAHVMVLEGLWKTDIFVYRKE